MFLNDSADLPVHCPTRAPLLDNGTVPIETHMSDFAFARPGSMINLPTSDTSAANAAPERQKKHGTVPLPCAAHGFPQRTAVRIIVNEDRLARALAQPIT